MKKPNHFLVRKTSIFLCFDFFFTKIPSELLFILNLFWFFHKNFVRIIVHSKFSGETDTLKRTVYKRLHLLHGKWVNKYECDYDVVLTIYAAHWWIKWLICFWRWCLVMKRKRKIESKEYQLIDFRTFIIKKHRCARCVPKIIFLWLTDQVVVCFICKKETVFSTFKISRMSCRFQPSSDDILKRTVLHTWASDTYFCYFSVFLLILDVLVSFRFIVVCVCLIVSIPERR